MQRTMSGLRPGQRAAILALTTRGPLRRRLMDLGLVPGAAVECLFSAGGGDPTAYAVGGTVLALRRDDAETVILCD